MNEQLQRVEKNIATVVTEFMATHVGKEFHASELRGKCALELGFANVAPGSPDRVMRSLRQQRRINYKLVNRAKSLYLGLPVEKQ